MENDTSLDFRLLSLRPVFEGEAKKGCELYLHPIFSVATKITILSRKVDLETLAAITCGMQTLISRKLSITLILFGADEKLLNKKTTHAISRRLGVYAFAKENTPFEFIVDPNPEAASELFAGTSCDTFLLLEDHNKNAIIIDWIKPLFSDLEPIIGFKIKWSYGDPLYQVSKTNEIIATFLRQIPKKDGAKWIKEFNTLLCSITPITVPFEEEFPSLESTRPSIKLYTHQEEAIRAWINNGRKGILKMCTGSGKTITALSSIKESDPNCGPILITVPTRVLADQWVEQVKAIGFPHVLRAYDGAPNWLRTLYPWLFGSNEKDIRIVITTYKTLADERFISQILRLAKKTSSAMWIADEMHNLASQKLMKVSQQIGQAFSQRMGLSATPEIEGDESTSIKLNNFFGGIVSTYDLEQGIKDGVLCNYRYYPLPAYLDPARGLEYIQTLKNIECQESSAFRQIELYRQSRELIRKSNVQLPALDSILDLLIAKNEDLKNTLVYCPPGSSGKSADETDETDEIESDGSESRLLNDVISMLRKRGLSVSSIIGQTAKAQRSAILERFSKGILDVLCAIGCLDEGIDIPSIRRAIVLYSIDREKQFVQRRGRILRTIRGTSKTADIYDVVILPHGTNMNPAETERLLKKELRRYQAFAKLALNAKEATQTIQQALAAATHPNI